MLHLSHSNSLTIEITSYANAMTDRAVPAVSKPAHVKVSPPLRPNITVQRVVSETSIKQLTSSDSRVPENVRSSLPQCTSQSAGSLKFEEIIKSTVACFSSIPAIGNFPVAEGHEKEIMASHHCGKQHTRQG